MMSENGPFRPDPKNPSQLVEDDYAWNRVANVVWLESPGQRAMCCVFVLLMC